MKDEKLPSDTYKLLYRNIVEDLLLQICDAQNNHCCVKYWIGEDVFHIALWKKYEEYRNRALKNMSSARLDRHKLASCICGAIVEVKPLTGLGGASIAKNANEMLGLYAGLGVLKYYMVYDLLGGQGDATVEEDAKRYLMDHYEVKFPGNIRDLNTYQDNMFNALYWSHCSCNYKQGECFCYDIWAYAKIFYHLELYNQEYLKNTYQEYLEAKQGV